MSSHHTADGQAPAIFRFGDFTFDFAKRLLLCGGVERHLSPKAQQLLYLLISARPRVLPREELYDALWPSTYVAETNLATIVNEVRRALGDDARAAHYIRTVHGFGYAFCGQVSQSAHATTNTVLVCEGRRYLLYDGENMIGRSAECRVVISDGAISRRHAVVTVKGSSVTIQDLNSMNGTYVDGRRIGRTPVPVSAGSHIQLGLLLVTLERRQNSSTATLVVDIRELERRVAERFSSA